MPLDAGALDRRIELGLRAACMELANEAKRVVSEPAPRKLVTGRNGIRYYRATTPATPGAPPRKLSGRGRAAITQEVDGAALVGRVGLNVRYMRRWEFDGHPWLSIAVEAKRGDIARLVGDGAAGSIGTGS